MLGLHPCGGGAGNTHLINTLLTFNDTDVCDDDECLFVVLLQEKSSGRTAHYKLTSTVMLWLQTTKTGSGTMNLGGSLTRQVRYSHTH